jgi:CRISPR-associated protein Cas1
MALRDHVASVKRLTGVWQTMLVGDRADDAPSRGVQRFAQEAPARIARLSQSLADGTYAPQPLYHTELPKPNGEVRALDIPPVADRLVEKALVAVIEPYVDPYISSAACGFRPGLGVVDAVQRIAQQRDMGLPWVLRTDLNDCFESIPVDVAEARLLGLLPDRSLDDLIRRLLSRPTVHGGRLRRLEGLAQGSALSPLLSNLVLTAVDSALLDDGFPVVRYADDMIVACASRQEAELALGQATQVVKGMGMTIENAKTEIMDFATGFCFLGEDFGPHYPVAQDALRVHDQLRKSLYIALQGSRVWTRRGRIIVTSKDDAEVLTVPSSHVSGIVLFGAVGLSAGVRTWLFQQGITTVFASRTGQYLGVEVPASSRAKVSRLRAQVRVADDPQRSLLFARAVVGAKIRHQITVVQRFNSRPAAEAVGPHLAVMRDMAERSGLAMDRASLMGVEGTAAKAYFSALAELVPEPLRFQGRSRRPPLDVFNAAISYGYAILLGECVSALVACGLEPGIGLLHADDDSRPSLALDLMEEFRPYVVDQAVLQLCRRNSLKPTDGTTPAGQSGIFLTKAGRQAVVDGYERRMLQVTRGALPGFSGSIRRHVYRQAQLVAQFVLGNQDDWVGLSWR